MNYKISIDYDDYFANSNLFNARNIEIVGDSIMFTTDKETIDLIDSKNIRYMSHESKKEKIKVLFKYKTGIIFGLLIAIFFVIMNTYRVSDVIFNENYPINSEIVSYIQNDSRRIMFLDFHKNNYQTLAKDIRSFYPEYEWISISKKGSVIYVNIDQVDLVKNEDNDLKTGNIVAKKSGMIKEFAIYNGSSNLTQNTYVREGDILISGQAKGYVLATVYEQITINVSKVSSKNEATGKVINYNQITLFGKEFNINKKENFNDSYNVTKNIFTIPYVISVNKIEEYEKNDIIFTYDKSSAITYAQTIIEDTFNKNKVLNQEEILLIENILTIENEDNFLITFLVKKIESIGEFIEAK